jgi:hypothetical protein
MAKRKSTKGQKDKQRSTKNIHIKLKTELREPRDELMFSEM